ncbi:bifunctional [glutamate--ammonia ligase]-adenylyl-L-tyrosine phosphorylase/[glutamate--ammonia-ligase] adenylyltransferase [Aestuariicella sp. G3-2]|uniref:bifunctional [glutamate--ammonia ligase]-adenylyl-L-tyrosine phosphorylase/[glutamate--ammonia-ligase] adenylyltransferase n=1 Tax=Pseudomaricurvus albidus TaxID=2842452 RepID=UPI001C0C8BFC|nr:bifunctional [glutamate--ammonia ligase]-adenylyl-L-tyrosine phosphorylase/[glutamate--ammonia-ligase] adenylyltransferase [Aestuariicella albida]MBU3068979.1 bifunctional [glutamate--ammonia ligase]-adenylyl-L-tyrosine phosphorylase/[glutamate--ammonia-ligase] adenylyltransferase [Aestuariicella albida]
MLSFDSIPARFHPVLQRQLELWQDRTSEDQQQRLNDWAATHPDAAQQLARLWVTSDYAAKIALDQTDPFLLWLGSEPYAQTLTQVEMAGQLALRLAEHNLDITSDGFEADDKAFDRQLRCFRRDMMLRILWRDFCRLADMTETTRDMSHLAEVTIQAAMAYHHHQLQGRFGIPMGKYSNTPQPMVVLGMGKLGGFELNVSSDIDLIFTYPESGETQPGDTGAKRSISNQEYFIKLGQKVINSLDSVTGDGFVFRVDMRLRPYGQSGALVLNFDAMEEYYQTQGREWERYAMIKARVVSGEVMPGGEQAGEQLMDLLRPFTYRRYLDFSAIDSMRDMKTLINREVQRKGISTDVKLGAGGIREIEFIVQVFQMIRGGKDVRLRERQVLLLLPLLEEEGFLPEGAAAELSDAYIFLRNTEHGIQGYQDKQTQSLPVDEPDQERLAWLMGYDSFEIFHEDLADFRVRVNAHFQDVIAEPEDSKQSDDDFAEWEPLWPKQSGPEDVLPDLEHYTSQLQEKGVVEPQQVAEILLELLSSRALQTMQVDGRTRLDALMPRLLALLSELQEPAETLRRILVLVEAVVRRTAYLLLLVENPDALRQLVRLCGSSSWIADQLAQHPALLDELLDPRSLYSPPDKNALRDELRQQVLRVSWDDLEGQMETLRYFRMAHGLRVAASEVTDVLPLMKVSDYLTWLAEVILEHVLNLAWQQMVERHGRPQPVDGQPEPDFVVVGYGKLGGIELGHGSDLDLVFIHDASAKGYSDGERSIDNQTFFTRLGQKMIHILNTQTISGKLYEVDMRLRPSGNSGLLVSSLTAFEKYQRNEAWTWEHQALTRARVVAGGERLTAEFEALRNDLLQQERDETSLKQDVVEMREKMRAHLGTKGSEEKKAEQFHLKQDAGGIVDIEFLVQYAVLAWSVKAPELCRWSDNIRILETLQQVGLLADEEASQLIEAYKAYRSAGHRLALQRLPGVVGGEEFQAERESVKQIWNRYLGG